MRWLWYRLLACYYRWRGIRGRVIGGLPCDLHGTAIYRSDGYNLIRVF